MAGAGRRRERRMRGRLIAICKLSMNNHPQDIKSYGCHENVLTLRMGSGVKPELVSFKLKEAIVVKELMDKVKRSISKNT